MKTVLVGISSRFIHSNLACYYLKEYCKDFDVEVVELNVNMPYEEIIEAVQNVKADFIGFSCYIFNIEVIKKLLTDLNAGTVNGRPRPKIILGGPEVSYEYEEFLPLCDYIVAGEGEEAFRQILSGEIEKDAGAASLCLKPAGEHSSPLHFTAPIATVIYGTKPDLKTAPSPYTEYLVDNVITAHKNNKILYFESSRGCPYKCSYCMSSLSGGVRFFPMERTKEQLKYLYSHRPKQIKFVDRTFNADIKRAKEIIRFILDMTDGDVSTNFHFEMSAEIVDDELIDIMSRAAKGLIQIEIGVQSFNPKALAACDRADDTQKLRQNLAKFMTLKNVHIHLDLIAGLPKDDYNSFRDSVNTILAFRPDYAQIGFLKLLKGSKMRRESEKYKIRYKQHAPYEIISSVDFSEEELNKLRTAASAVGAFYNKSRYRVMLEETQEKFASAFDMYLKIGEELASGKYKKSELKDMYRLLLDLT